MRSPSTRPAGRARTAAITTGAVAFAATLAVAIPLSVRTGPAAASGVVASNDTSPPRIRAVWFSRRSVAVSGLAVVPVTVSVRVTDPSGVTENPNGFSASPQVILGPVPGPRSKLQPTLTRTSGTVTDGIWSATVNVPSTWNGTVRVISVGATDRLGNVRYDTLSPAQAPALRVRGTHRPALTLHYSLRPDGLQISGRAYFTDTRRPLARTPLAASFELGCDIEGGAVNNIVTNARGFYVKRWVYPDTAVGCVALIGARAPGQRPTVLAYRIGFPPPPAIPDEAMLRGEDLGGAEPEPATGDLWAEYRPPQPCADRPYPGSNLRRDHRAIYTMIGVDNRPTVVMEHVATYRLRGAHRYLAELRRALATCRGVDGPQGQWTVRARGVAGDDSLLLEHRTYIDYAGTYHNTYVVVARVGRVLVVVANTGWETSSGQEDVVRELSTKAVRRAAILNRR
jgi:hypothetical protein